MDLELASLLKTTWKFAFNRSTYNNFCVIVHGSEVKEVSMGDSHEKEIEEIINIADGISA
jgi:hypothetical protein